MPIKELAKGNRLEDLTDGGAHPVVLGYRIHTGPPGTETDDSSFCGDSQVLDYFKAQFPGLAKHPQGVCDCNGTWSAWLLTYEPPDDSDPECESQPAMVCYPAEQGQRIPGAAVPESSHQEAEGSYKDPSRPGSSWRTRKDC